MRSINAPSYSFVASVEKIYRDLGDLGMTLYGIDRELASDYMRLFDTIFEVQPHAFGGTPSLADKCCRDPRFSEEYIRDLRLIILGGEVIPTQLAEKLLSRFPKANLLCSFGSTELTSGTIKFWITREMLRDGKQLPVGSPVNSTAYIADENGNELGDEEIGELFVVSDMVALGYFNDPQRTAQKFFTTSDGQRGCRTGDLVWREGDVFYYVGRVDNQVKVGGYRVEIEDVERHMRKVSLIKECAVAPVIENERVALLTAFVILKDRGFTPIESIIAIKREMAATVQPYMIPQKIVFVDSLPSNSNNKLDRNILKEMANKNK